MQIVGFAWFVITGCGNPSIQGNCKNSDGKYVNGTFVGLTDNGTSGGSGAWTPDSGSATEEIEDRRVGLVRERPAYVVRPVLDLDDREIGDQLLVPEPRGRRLERENPVGGAVNGQRRDVDLGQIPAKVRQPGINASI